MAILLNLVKSYFFVGSVGLFQHCFSCFFSILILCHPRNTSDGSRQYSGNLAHPRGMYYNGKEGGQGSRKPNSLSIVPAPHQVVCICMISHMQRLCVSSSLFPAANKVFTFIVVLLHHCLLHANSGCRILLSFVSPLAKLPTVPNQSFVGICASFCIPVAYADGNVLFLMPWQCFLPRVSQRVSISSSVCEVVGAYTRIL